MKHRMLLGLVLVGLFWASAAAGPTDSAAVNRPVPLTAALDTVTDVGTSSLIQESVPSLARILAALMVIIIVIYVGVFLLRRMSGNRLGAGRGKTIQVIEQTYLAPKKSVCLLKLADRAVLIGITDASITMLTELEWESLPPDVVKKLAESPAGFSGFLNDAAGKLFGGRSSKGAGRE
jgi:flagellar biosynthetic protein FliO